MSSAADPHSILNKKPLRIPEASIRDVKAKILRHRAGKAPDWAIDDDDNDDIFPMEFDLKSLGNTSITSKKLNERLAGLQEIEKSRENMINTQKLIQTRNIPKTVIMNDEKKEEKTNIIAKKKVMENFL